MDVGQLATKLKGTLQFLEVRTTPMVTDYFEAVLGRSDLQRCTALLVDAFGPPAKNFDQVATLEPKIRKAIDTIGGIQHGQCLFLNHEDPTRLGYAALWPWASNHERITLKMGMIAVR